MRTRSNRGPIVYVRVANATFPHEDFFLCVPPEYADRSPTPLPRGSPLRLFTDGADVGLPGSDHK